MTLGGKPIWRTSDDSRGALTTMHVAESLLLQSGMLKH